MNTQQENIVYGEDEQEVWEQLEAQLLEDDQQLEFYSTIWQDTRKIELAIEIDLGGGFEGGNEQTTLSAPLSTMDDFRFAIHEQGFFDEMGKFLGMQDIEIGHPELDHKLMVKTNDPSKVRFAFADENVQEVLLSLEDFSFHITDHYDSESRKHEKRLELEIQHGITNPIELRSIYNAYYSVLEIVDPI